MGSKQSGFEALERGEQARREHRPDDARMAFAEAAEVFRRRGIWAELAHSLARQAQIERDTGQFDQAIAFQEEALGIARDLGDDTKLVHVLRHLGDILQASGRHTDADPFYREMLSLYRSLPDTAPLELANAVRSVAMHEQSLGNVSEARTLWQEARDRYSRLDEVFKEMTGKEGNPGVEEADKRLSELGAR